MTASDPTIKIFFENFAITGEDTERLSLSRLDTDFHSHIHGGLRIQIQGRFLPSLGYFGADDVCFNTWLVELENIYKLFEKLAIASYTFDEGEQGQPAFMFEKADGNVFLSIVDSQYSNEGADPEWQRVEFLHHDFQEQYLSMKARFLSELGRFAPNTKDTWLKQVFSGATV